MGPRGLAQRSSAIGRRKAQRKDGQVVVEVFPVQLADAVDDLVQQLIVGRLVPVRRPRERP
jgi:hypothetical protein